MKMRSHGVLLFAWLIAIGAEAATLVNEGVLGNSGEQGATLVRFSNEPATGLGIAYDRFGTLWDRGGNGTLNRYALDGRLIAQYRLPRETTDWTDQSVLVGDTLVFQIRGKLYTMPITAPAGAEAKPLGRASDVISYGVVNGQIASRIKEDIFLLNVPTGTAKPVATVKDVREIELAPDGAVYANAAGKLHKFVNGAEASAGWPAQIPGGRPQLIDGFWFGNSYATTIRRYSASMEPQPGVVLGGSSGSVIGHLDKNGELHHGRGLAKIRDNLFAVSGDIGVAHLLEWKNERQQFEIIRRIGCVQFCRGLGLDGDGNVWYYAGAWRWSDQPDTPLRLGVGALDFPGIGQIAMQKDGTMLAVGSLGNGSVGFYFGKLNKEVSRPPEITERVAIPGKNVTGTVVVTRNKRPTLLMIDAAGEAQAFNIGGDSSYTSYAGPVSLKVSAPAKSWTTLAMRDPTTLLAAGDGAVIEFQPDGANDWRETRRWNSWGTGPSDKFGSTIFITADAGRLWVGDRERQRVLCMDLASNKPISSFGVTDQPGDTLNFLSKPETIAAFGDRAVIYDSANQRLIKLRLHN